MIDRNPAFIAISGAWAWQWRQCNCRRGGLCRVSLAGRRNGHSLPRGKAGRCCKQTRRSDRTRARRNDGPCYSRVAGVENCGSELLRLPAVEHCTGRRHTHRDLWIQRDGR